MDHFAKKNILSVILSRLQRFFPVDFNFLPDYYLLPDEIEEFEEHMQANTDQTFIAKPSNGKAGVGIKLLKKFDDLPKRAFKNEYLLQRYVENPLLVNNKKFDVRLFLLISGIDPVQGHLCDEGLARFCTHNYSKPNETNMKNNYMHLTNFSINKKS